MTTETQTADIDRITITARIYLGRLFILRNFGVLGIAVLIFVAWNTFDVNLRFSAIAITLFSIILINGLTWLRLRQTWPVTDQEVFFQLCLDVLALGILFYLSGGSTNPFVSLLLFPLILAATLLPARYSWAMAGITVLCYTLLLYWYIPLTAEMRHMPGMESHEHLSPDFHLHVMGMWVNFVISAGLVATVVVRMTRSICSRDRMLAAAREETLRNERIIAVGSMAAGTAHELGTPLSTIAVICNELQSDYGNDKKLADSLKTMRTQVDQCKLMLSNMLAKSGNARAIGDVTLALDKHIERILDKWLLVRPNVNVTVKNQGQDAPPEIVLDQTIDQALMNLLNNAADASPDNVEVDLDWSTQEAVITICDRGPGLSDEALRHVGKAFFTTKSPGHGIGIGLYLANATIERFGGEVRWFNRDGGGAALQVTLPINMLRPASE